MNKKGEGHKTFPGVSSAEPLWVPPVGGSVLSDIARTAALKIRLSPGGNLRDGADGEALVSASPANFTGFS